MSTRKYNSIQSIIIYLHTFMKDIVSALTYNNKVYIDICTNT